MGLLWCLAAAFLFLLFLPGLSTGQRVVTVQEGPLFRVKGSHVTLWCKVSGYQGPSEQNFQWSIYLPSAPEREVQIVSTSHPSFPYAIYAQRVRSRGIYVERLQGDAVLLHISELQERDAGEYECHTPNTDERYFGSYSAKTNLSVIADTLSASMVPQVLNITEGDVVELTCEVSKSTAQHTHLSVSWYHFKGAEEHWAEEVLTLSKDFILRPGPSYAQRFLAGDVQMSKVGNTTFKLSIGRVEPSDQGQLYCEAAEWIEDPDETWKDISHKQTKRTSLVVERQGSDLSVGITAAERFLSEGDSLKLNCTVGAQKSSKRHFQVLWLLNGMEVARVDPHGVWIWEEEYEERAKLGQLQAFKHSNTVYVLTIYKVGLKDSGTYHCSVSEVKTPGDIHSIQSNVSAGIHINVKLIGVDLQATLRSRAAIVAYGQSFELICQVSGSYTLEEVPVSVGWFFQPTLPTAHYHELVRVSPSGTVAWRAVQRNFQGKAQLTKAASSFRLHIHGALPADEGTYQCEVEVWRKNTLTLGQPVSTTRSNAVGIKVVLPESNFQIATKESSVEIADGANTAIECKIMVAQNNSQFAITWYHLPPFPADASPLQILRVNYSSITEYGAEFSSPTQKTRFLSQRVSSDVFSLWILSANPEDQGSYYCVVEEWLWLVNGWYKLGEGASGRTTLELKLPESTVLSRICSSPSLLNFILYLPLVLILLLALAVFCCYFKFGKNKKGSIKGGEMTELQEAGGSKENIGVYNGYM